MTATVSAGAKNVENSALCALPRQGHGGCHTRQLLALQKDGRSIAAAVWRQDLENLDRVVRKVVVDNKLVDIAKLTVNGLSQN
jgi:hypothetical protein